MCGIAGIIGHCVGAVEAAELVALRTSLRHRGPDDSGTWCNPSRSTGFVQTRLSILDLSAAGHQPMSTADGRYTIVFNGEIYNFREFRPELERDGIKFRSDSDTEVILYLFAKYGDKILDMLSGMFAFAIWDKETDSCFVARDPLGIKPLYYGIDQGRIIFASETRAVLKAWRSKKVLDPQSLGQYLLFGNIPDPGTLVQDVQSLPAGMSMKVHKGKITLNQYWQPTYGSLELSNDEASQRTRNALDESMRRHLVSDVPVGIFLSGGMDSTALVALASKMGMRDVNTFCISFDEVEFNEGPLARQTAEHFKTRHHEWRLTAEDGLALVDGFLNALDRPTNDGFNTYCVSMLARKHGLKVVLSGLGGDELFGSYPSFQLLPKLLRWHAMSDKFGPLKHWAWSALERTTHRANLRRLSVFMREKLSPLAAYWTIRGFFSPDETKRIVQHYTGDTADKVASLFDMRVSALPSEQDLVAYLESTRYMQFQLLRDSDVFSMAHGLELRVPFVDRKLFETVNQIPSVIRLAPGKRLLCDAVPEIPAWVANAPKRGFRFPFESWVQERWSDRFTELKRAIPVELDSWYRVWTLFTLEHYLKENGVN